MRQTDEMNEMLINPDFLALGMGGTNMMAMLWTIAMGRRAVGVEMRGDPFLGVHCPPGHRQSNVPPARHQPVARAVVTELTRAREDSPIEREDLAPAGGQVFSLNGAVFSCSKRDHENARDRGIARSEKDLPMRGIFRHFTVPLKDRGEAGGSPDREAFAVRERKGPGG